MCASFGPCFNSSCSYVKHKQPTFTPLHIHTQRQTSIKSAAAAEVSIHHPRSKLPHQSSHQQQPTYTLHPHPPTPTLLEPQQHPHPPTSTHTQIQRKRNMPRFRSSSSPPPPCHYPLLGQITAGLCLVDMLVTTILLLCVKDWWQAQVSIYIQRQTGSIVCVCVCM